MKAKCCGCFVFVCSIAFCLSAAQAHAQNGIWGYSSLDYDLATQQFTGYSETDMSGPELGYYIPNVSVSLTDPNGSIVYSGSTGGSPTARLTFSYRPGPLGNYTLKGNHFLTLRTYLNGCWLDYYDYAWDTTLGISAPFEFLFTSGPEVPNTNSYPSVILGGTQDVVSTSTPACTPPTDESSTFTGWNSSTQGQFVATLLPSGYTYDQHYVREADYAQGVNGCWWDGNGASMPHYIGVQGSAWLVGNGFPSNQYGHDTIGYELTTVSYIQNYAPLHNVHLPCTLTFYQQMMYECDATTWFWYKNNVLTQKIDADSVTVCRGASVCGQTP
jgi:hypothetical protein